jgi:hypothetical protein
MHTTGYDKFGNATTFKDAKPDDLGSFILFVNEEIDKMLKDISAEQRKHYSKQRITFNEYPAVVSYNEKSTIANKIFVYHNHRVFLISYNAFDEHVEIANKILSAFRFTY